MMLIELTTVPASALPVAEFRDHLRLGSGFAEEAAEDSLLEALLRAAISAVEARTAKALLERDFALTLRAWRDGTLQPLPVAPVGAVSALYQMDADTAETALDPNAWTLVTDTHCPGLTGAAGQLPPVPAGGAVRIEFTAGYGANWSDVPADIAHAVMLLAATYYEYRHESANAAAIMPHGVAALLEPHRALRLGGGRV